MRLTKTLLTTAAAVVVLSTGAFAEGDSNQNSDINAGTSSTNSMSADEMGANSPTGASSSTNATASTAVNLDAGTVEQVQASLKNEGYSVSTDGVWGPKSAEALRQFQQANGLSVTGTVNTETLAALDITR